MGLDTTHGCWNGPYSAFMRFRRYVASAAGIPLDLMAGFYERPHEDALRWMAPAPGGPACGSPEGPLLHRWACTVDAQLPLSWTLFEGDPIVILLNHSDCDGSIAPEACEPLANRMEQLAPDIARAVDASDHRATWMVDAVGRWISGLRAAAAAGEPVEFH